eukprot:TRINITY_DN234_c0_g1_i1.p1 TRINITY_DN234_c0_g1~~TRINITY_DN234_c0_g1_i1.p1  ORF type:complete len:142 (+),score=34.69 TRINITY_DN234_c0_g1_i1:127-552(+)
MADKLPPDLKQEYTEIYSSCVKGGGVISDVNTFGNLMRAVGQNYTPAELQKKLGGTMNLNQFLEMMANTLVKEDTTEDIIEAFKVFDKDGSGTMQITDLRYILSSLGDRLEEDQVEEIMSRISSHSGSFNYKDLVSQLRKK